MDLVSLATDRFCGYRLEGFSCEHAFHVTQLEMYRYLMDFVYYSGEPMSETLFSQMNFIAGDVAFTQNAEMSFQVSRQKVKSPA